MKDKRDKKQNIIIILLVVIIFILLFPALLLGGVFYSSTSQMAKHPIPASTQRVVTAQMVADMISDSCTQVWGNNFEADLDEDTGFFIVKTWMTYIDDGLIERVKAGENVETWNDMSADLKSTADAMQKAFIENGHDEITAVLTVCNPDDHSIEYLTIANGIIGLDVVNGIDMRKTS